MPWRAAGSLLHPLHGLPWYCTSSRSGPLPLFGNDYNLKQQREKVEVLCWWQSSILTQNKRHNCRFTFNTGIHYFHRCTSIFYTLKLCGKTHIGNVYIMWDKSHFLKRTCLLHCSVSLTIFTIACCTRPSTAQDSFTPKFSALSQAEDGLGLKKFGFKNSCAVEGRVQRAMVKIVKSRFCVLLASSSVFPWFCVSGLVLLE